MLSDLRRAVDHLFDPEFRWLLVSGVAVALVLLTISTVLVYWAASIVQDLGLAVFAGGINQLLASNTLATMFGLSVILMIPIAALQLVLFRDRVAIAVELSHYPRLYQDGAYDAPLGFLSSLRFLILLLVGNTCIGLLFQLNTGLAMSLFWIVNGILLGREYFYLVAVRRIDAIKALEQADEHRWRVYGAGIFMAICLSVPVLNLMVPVLAIAAFTHMVNRLNPFTDNFGIRLDEYRRWYDDREAIRNTQAAVARAKAEEEAAAKETLRLLGKPAPKRRSTDPDDPSTWVNVFSDLSKHKRV